MVFMLWYDHFNVKQQLPFFANSTVISSNESTQKHQIQVIAVDWGYQTIIKKYQKY